MCCCPPWALEGVANDTRQKKGTEGWPGNGGCGGRGCPVCGGGPGGVRRGAELKKVSSYIAQYPVLRTVQSALHFTSGQTCSLRHHLGFPGKHPAICYN